MTIDAALEAAIRAIVRSETAPALAPLERRLAWLELRYRTLEGLIASELEVSRDDVQHLVDQQIASLH
jgi:phage baseplate assembly protein W